MAPYSRQPWPRPSPPPPHPAPPAGSTHSKHFSHLPLHEVRQISRLRLTSRDLIEPPPPRRSPILRALRSAAAVCAAQLLNRPGTPSGVPFCGNLAVAAGQHLVAMLQCACCSVLPARAHRRVATAAAAGGGARGRCPGWACL